jgi:outer membrane biogenesis lipoprotein LolB
MNASRFSHFVACVFATSILASSSATAQLTPQQVVATNKVLQQVQSTIAKLPATQQKMLDGYANISHLADKWQTYGMHLT